MSWKDFPANLNLKLDYIIRDQAKFSWRKKLKYFFSKLVPSPVLTCYAIHSNATSIPFRDTVNVTYLHTFRDLKRVQAGALPPAVNTQKLPPPPPPPSCQMTSDLTY